MAEFTYRAANRQGQLENGRLQAATVDEAQAALQARGLVPIRILLVETHRGGRWPIAGWRTDWWMGKRATRWTLRDRALWARELGILLEAGVPIEQALGFLLSAGLPERMHRVLAGVREKVRQGYGLGKALSEFALAFPPLIQATVHAAEQAGMLQQALLELADHLEQQAAFAQEIRQMCVYPLSVIGAAVGMMGFLLVYVVPKIAQVFEDAGQTLPAVTRALIGLSQALAHYGFAFMGIAMCVILGGWQLYRSYPRWRLRMQAVCCALPLLGRVIREVLAVRFARTLAFLLRAGLPIVPALGHAKGVIAWVYWEQRMEQAVFRVQSGEPVFHAVAQTGLCSPLLVHCMQAGEGSGQLDKLLAQAALVEAQRLRDRLRLALRVLEPAIIVGMGLGVMVIVWAILLPIFQMNDWVM